MRGKILSATLPPAALRAATLTGATVLGQKDHLGTLTPGKLADLILLSANPLEDIRNTRRIELVIRSGQLSRPPSC